MNRKNLLLVLLTVTGLTLIYGSANKQPRKVKISEINKEMVGHKITVTGQIRNLSAVKDTVFFTLKGKTGKIPAVTFRENLLLYESLKIQASGKVTIYKGKTELVINQVEKL